MQEASAGFRGHAVAAVCGSKGTGKSTFGRLLLNSLLSACSEVAWLDTDCGQPEFTVPGLSSTLGRGSYDILCYTASYRILHAACGDPALIIRLH